LYTYTSKISKLVILNLVIIIAEIDIINFPHMLT
jgi:hypothetical protein